MTFIAKIKTMFLKIIRKITYSQYYTKLIFLYKVYINYKFSLINIIKTVIIIHMGFLLVNPYGSFYQSFYLLYKNHQLQNNIKKLKLQIYLNNSTIKALKNQSQDTLEELLIPYGYVINPNAKIILLDENN